MSIALYLDGWSNLESYKQARTPEQEKELRALGYKTLKEWDKKAPEELPVEEVATVEPIAETFFQKKRGRKGKR